MRPTGAPDLVGEIRYQHGAVATTVVVDGHMVWEVRREHDDHVRHTPQLAHTSHWHETPLGARARTMRTPVAVTRGPGMTAAAEAGTLFYPDCSNNNWSTEQDAIDFVNQLIPQGFSGMCHKVSEGDYYEDPFWPAVLKACREANLPVLGYHYVTTNSGASQAQTYRAAGGLDWAMFDWEANSGDFANYLAVDDAFTAAGVTPGVGYCPRWYYDEVGGGDLSQVPALVSSAYPGGNGYASTIYYAGGGDTGTGWQPYGGATPECWQFTDRALIAGITVDCNAFKGTPEQLSQLFTGGPVTQPTPSTDPAADNQIQLRGPNLDGWPQLAGHTVVDALAAIGEKLGIPGFTPPAQ